MWKLHLILGLIGILSRNFEPVQGQLETVNAGELGNITGLRVFTFDGLTPYVTFNGIPYAKPESYTGDKRFEPSELWRGALPSEPFQALNPLVYCPQNGILPIPAGSKESKTSRNSDGDFRKLFLSPFMDGRIGQNLNFNKSDLVKDLMGQEDCLVLNVNTPKIPLEGEELNYPVIVFLHGGAASSLWGSIWNGMRLLTENVVLVTINYRLSILGSFNLAVNEAPGNAAIYDAITSLQWIQNYIKYFGGDPTRVTISGQSAGAMMCAHLLVSPLAKGLFQNVIGNSGSALAVWGTAKPNYMESHLRVAELAGCNQTEHNEIISCMKTTSYEVLLEAASRESLEQENQGKGLEFEHRVPAVQIPTPSLTIPLVLPKHPLEVMKDGEQNDAAVMFGATRHDGSIYVSTAIFNHLIMHNNLLANETFMKNGLIPTALKMMGLDHMDPIMVHSLTKHYLKDSANSGDFFEKVGGLIDMASVLGMREGSLYTVELNSRMNPKSYSYSFDHKGMFSELFYGVLFGHENIPGGIAHTEDMLYLFQFLPLIDQKDLEVARRMVKYWVNFAYYGNPNGDVSEENEIWPRHNSESQPYLKISTGEDKVGYMSRDRWTPIGEELITESWLFHFNKVRQENGIAPIPPVV